MIVVNLWFIKHSNGLFHYGLDYAGALSADVAEIWVRDAALAECVARALPGMSVRVLDIRSLVRAAIDAARKGRTMFTASSHPIPFVPGQTVVVHDSFPFEGGCGRLKRLLFRAGLASSRAVAGYINRADAKRFLARCGMAPSRTRYLPNRIGAAPERLAGAAIVRDVVSVGLFGSDSPKKNYDALFAAAGSHPAATAIAWRIFGHENDYTRRLRRDYPECAITVVASDDCSMDDFVRSIDLAVSVAEGEGFARPVARSLMSGIPTMLLDTPIFREFYTGSATLFPDVAALASAIARLRPGDELCRPTLRSADVLRADFERGVAWLKARENGPQAGPAKTAGEHS